MHSRARSVHRHGDPQKDPEHRTVLRDVLPARRTVSRSTGKQLKTPDRRQARSRKRQIRSDVRVASLSTEVLLMITQIGFDCTQDGYDYRTWPADFYARGYET